MPQTPGTGTTPNARPASWPPLSSRMDCRTIYHALLERLWLVVLCFVVGTVCALAHLRRAPRVFAATATLQVEQQEQKVVKFEKVQQEDLRFQDMLQTLVHTIASRPVLERVVRDNPQLFTSASGIEATHEEAARLLAGMIDVRLRRGTRLIDITVVHTHPVLCETLANSLARQYIRHTFEQQSASSQMASEFLIEESQRLKRKLQDSEGKLQAYKEQVKSISLEDRHDIVSSRLKELSQRVNEAKTARTRLEVGYAQAQKLGTNVAALLVVPSIATDATVASVAMNVSRLQNEFATLQQRYKEKHPKYLQAASQLKEWRDTLARTVLSVSQTMAATYENARATEAALEQSLHEQENLAMELGRRGVQYAVLQREIESDRALYDSVLTRLKETTLTKDLQTDKVRIHQFASLPRAPVSPRVGKVLFLGVFGGLATGVAFALGLRSLDNTVTRVDQAEELLHLPALTVIQHLRSLRRASPQLVVHEQPHSPGAEAFRTLRTAVSTLGRPESRRVLLVTSAVPKEGKTFCAANYALCQAQAGLKTVLIDADLRHPAVERVLTGRNADLPGLTDFLTARKPLAAVVHATAHENLFFMPAGMTSRNPAELLAHDGFRPLLERLLSQADRVVIDSPPIHAVSDTLLLAKDIHTVLLVVRAGRTPWRASARAIEALQQAGTPVTGVVLNGIKIPRLDRYGYNTYYSYCCTASYGHKGVYPKQEQSSCG